MNTLYINYTNTVNDVIILASKKYKLKFVNDEESHINIETILDALSILDEVKESCELVKTVLESGEFDKLKKNHNFHYLNGAGFSTIKGCQDASIHLINEPNMVDDLLIIAEVRNDSIVIKDIGSHIKVYQHGIAFNNYEKMLEHDINKQPKYDALIEGSVLVTY